MLFVYALPQIIAPGVISTQTSLLPATGFGVNVGPVGVNIGSPAQIVTTPAAITQPLVTQPLVTQPFAAQPLLVNPGSLNGLLGVGRTAIPFGQRFGLSTTMEFTVFDGSVVCTAGSQRRVLRINDRGRFVRSRGVFCETLSQSVILSQVI